MRIALMILFICFASISCAQTLYQQLAGIRTTKQAKNFLVKNLRYQGRLFQIDANIDTSDFQQPFYSKNAGDIFTIGPETYKVISSNTTTLSRVYYIFWDGVRMSFRKIETLRRYILNDYNKGVLFDTLVVKYSTDGVKDLGDTSWFTDDEMAKEFSEEVWLHRAREEFTLGES